MLLERADGQKSSTYRYGTLLLSPSRHEVTVEGREVMLTAKEFGLLEHLLRSPGRVLTRDVLPNNVWGYDYHGTTRTVDVHVRRLKENTGLNNVILSVKALGYKLKEDSAGQAHDLLPTQQKGLLWFNAHPREAGALIQKLTQHVGVVRSSGSAS